MYFCKAVTSFVHPNQEFSFESAGATAGEKNSKPAREKQYFSVTDTNQQ